MPHAINVLSQYKGRATKSWSNSGENVSVTQSEALEEFEAFCHNTPNVKAQLVETGGEMGEKIIAKVDGDARIMG